MKRFSIIGAGNLGAYLIDSLVKNGYSLKYIYKKSKTGGFDFAITGDIRLLVEQSDFIIISTQESKIREAAELAAVSSHPKGKVFFHTSNSLTSDELASLKKKGAHVASFSPLQTFPGYSARNSEHVFNGIYFLVEGDQKAVHLARQIAADLGAYVLAVEKSEKIYFHIAGVAASNFLIAILELAERQLKKVGTHDIKILLPLIRQTLKNVESGGVAASLTGPVKRKEMDIVKKHLEVLEKNPDEAALYKALAKFLQK
ncbi:MAG: DUF2520 domain-containing protein [Candidatus Aminicenantes bacterium]|nr:MAG: DUF2520 domain-containing protein [Candidatus Aminicenantes bacterium]